MKPGQYRETIEAMRKRIDRLCELDDLEADGRIIVTGKLTGEAESVQLLASAIKTLEEVELMWDQAPVPPLQTVKLAPLTAEQLLAVKRLHSRPTVVCDCGVIHHGSHECKLDGKTEKPPALTESSSLRLTCPSCSAPPATVFCLNGHEWPVV